MEEVAVTLAQTISGESRGEITRSSFQGIRNTWHSKNTTLITNEPRNTLEASPWERGTKSQVVLARNTLILLDGTGVLLGDVKCGKKLKLRKIMS